MKQFRKNTVSFHLGIRCLLTKEEYDILNQKIDVFLYEDYPVFEDDFLFEERLCNIIIENLYPINQGHEVLYHSKLTLGQNKSVEYSLEILKMFRDKYSKYLQDILEDNQIIFEQGKDIDDKSYFDSRTSIIHMKMCQNISDVLTLIHEFIHFTNTRKEYINSTTSYYTECFSIFSELLAKDYIVKKYPKYEKDVLKEHKNNFITLYQDNICLKVILELLKKKINGIQINQYELHEIMETIYQYQPDPELINTIFDTVISEVLEEDQYSFEDTYILHTRNTVGLVLACYMYEMKKNDIWNLNDILYQMNTNQVLTYLNLEFNKDKVFDLTEESYKNLEKSYKNSLKNLW